MVWVGVGGIMNRRRKFVPPNQAIIVLQSQKTQLTIMVKLTMAAEASVSSSLSHCLNI